MEKIGETDKREKLKEELLRQYEAGQLKECVPGSLLSSNNNVPKQIPTIEEHRQANSSALRRSLAVSLTRSSVVTPATASVLPPLQLPDVSRPPPGYNFSSSAAAALTLPAVSSYLPQTTPLPTPAIIPTASYEESLVNKVLQSILGNSATATCKPTVAETSSLQTPGPVDKVMNWDTNLDRRPREDSLDYKSSEGYPRDRHNRESRKRSRSFSPERLRFMKRERSMSRSHSRRSPRRSQLHTPPRPRGRSPSYPRHYPRHDEYDRSRQSRVLSPLTRKYFSPRPSHYRPSLSPTRHQSRGHERYRSRSPRRHSRSPRRRYHDARSPRSRKIVFSPHRHAHEEGKMRHESPAKARKESRSPSRTRIRERIGVRRQDPLVEVFNMDDKIGQCRQVAIIKEYIDSTSGILELRTTEGGPGDIILFNEKQVWMADRAKDPNGPPILFVEKCKENCLDLQSLFPVGKEVFLNARRVKSDLVNLQATVIWPKYTEDPKYKLKPSKLDEDLHRFHRDCSREKLVPICINGLPPVGSLNIWSAKVKEIINEEFGIVEVTCDPRDGKKEFTHKFNCFFRKSDLWLENGVCVGQSLFYESRSLSELVSLMQPVDLVARSIIREKGQFMKKSFNSTIEMQAICVSLKTSCIPRRAPKGSKVEGGPGAFGGCNRGETPYMFQIGLKDELNVVLRQFLKSYGKTCVNMDPELIKQKSSPKVSEEVRPAKKVFKITEEETEIKTPPVLEELVSNVKAIITVPPDVNGYGLLESWPSREWKAVFHVDDAVLVQGAEDLKLGSKFCVNANLVDASLPIQYIASCIWKKLETPLEIPNNLPTKCIKSTKIDQFHHFNLKSFRGGSIGNLPKHLELKTGVIVKIIDYNYGIINQDGKFVLFDTCDFWISPDKTAAKNSLKLGNVVSLGELVCFHGALVNPWSTLPYLATSVWTEESIQGDQAPIPINRDKIHPDKIKVYQTVSSSPTIIGELKDVQKNEGDAMMRGHLSNVSGVVKFGVHLGQDDTPSAGLVEMKGCSGIKAFFLASIAVEAHEKLDVCVPGTEVTFSASPLSSEFAPISHVVTAISSVHQQVSNHSDKKVIADRTQQVVAKIKLDSSLIDFSRSDPDLLYFGIYKRKSRVVDCVPTGRLVCMIDKNSGILESHDREFAYFELSDTNLPSSLLLKDVVKVMSRCRDVSFRFQASPALSGPVKLIVHDGSVSFSSNLDKYYPEVKLKKASPKMEENSFTKEKLIRAQKAIEKLKNKDILSIEKILKSSRYESILDSKKDGKTISDETLEKRTKEELKASMRSNVEERCLKNANGRLKSFLNESFGLIEFDKEDGSKGFCLFDSFDLHLPGKEELKNSTIDQHLTIGETTYFNAYEFCPDNTVSWLANGVWKQEVSTTPDPIPVSQISKEKIVVFEKVAETCSIMIDEEKKNQEQDKILSMVDDSSDVNMNQTPIAVKEKNPKVEPPKEKLLDFEVENMEVNHLGPNNFEAAGLIFTVGNKKVKCLTHYSRVWMKDHPMNATKEEWDLMQRSKKIKVRVFPTKDFKGYKYLAHFVLVRKEKENESSMENHEKSYVSFESSVSDVKAQNNLHEFTHLVQ